jgi:hypothetical protein
LELIDPDTYMSLFQNMNRRRWRGRMREPYDDPRDMPLEQPRMLRRSAQVIVDAGLFGSRAFLAALPHPQKEIQSLLGLNDNFFSESKVVRLPTAKSVQNELDAIDLESGNVIAFTRTAKSDFRY